MGQSPGVLVLRIGRASSVVARINEHILVVLGIQPPRQTQLLVIAHALDPLSFQFGFAEGGQYHRRQNRDDGDHNKQLD